MKVNKLKILSIAICCLVSVLWSQAQGMEGNIERSSLNFDFTCEPLAKVFKKESPIKIAG